MKKITLLVGLPGSGKTHYGDATDYYFIDDIKDFNDISKALEDHETVLVADPHLCNDSTRQKANELLTKLNAEVEWLYWENDVSKALNNIEYRDDGKAVHKSFVQRLSKAYNPPRVDFEIWQR